MQKRGSVDTTLHKTRALFGENHPHTLTAAMNLAFRLRQSGDYNDAYALNQETLHKTRALFGERTTRTRSPAR